MGARASRAGARRTRHATRHARRAGNRAPSALGARGPCFARRLVARFCLCCPVAPFRARLSLAPPRAGGVRTTRGRAVHVAWGYSVLLFSKQPSVFCSLTDHRAQINICCSRVVACCGGILELRGLSLLGVASECIFHAPSRHILERAYACCVSAVRRADQLHDAKKAASSGAAPPACARACCVATYGATPRARNGITFHHPCHFGSDLDQIYGHRTLPSRVTNGDANWARLGRSNIFRVIQKGQLSRKGITRLLPAPRRMRRFRADRLAKLAVFPRGLVHLGVSSFCRFSILPKRDCFLQEALPVPFPSFLSVVVGSVN